MLFLNVSEFREICRTILRTFLYRNDGWIRIPEDFVHFSPQCLLSFRRDILYFKPHLTCLQVLSIQTKLRFCNGSIAGKKQRFLFVTCFRKLLILYRTVPSVHDTGYREAFENMRIRENPGNHYFPPNFQTFSTHDGLPLQKKICMSSP